MAMLEVCVDSAAGLDAALAGGADRIELCSALAVGGLTPSAGLMLEASSRSYDTGVPVIAMIRHRPGDFVMSSDDLDIAHADLQAAKTAGLSGVVIGASLPDGRLDEPVLFELTREAGRMDVTLHRCFDLVPDVAEALDVMRRVGIKRVLTSGGAPRVEDGLGRLRVTLHLAAPDIVVMPGSGVTSGIVPQLRLLGVKEVHASCSVPVKSGGPVAQLGFVTATDRQTDASVVRALKERLE